MTREDRARAAHNLHLGVVIDEHKLDPAPGDFLIRAVLQADPESGAISVGDVLTVGQTVQFQVRDAATADADLRALLAERLSQTGGRDPVGALLFTCNGRGSNLFGSPHHDVSALRDGVPDLPVAGMFCGGEIGPIGGKTSFTASPQALRCSWIPCPRGTRRRPGTRSARRFGRAYGRARTAWGRCSRGR